MFALLVFITGMLTFLAPCTLPILPAYLAFSTTPSRTSTLLRTTMFGTGVIIVFIIFGALAGSIGTLLAQHKVWVARASGLLFIALGIAVLSGRSAPGFSIRSRPSRTLLGSFAFGIIFALSWSGCIGPVLGAVLLLAANTSASQGAVLLFIYALGLLLPLLAVSVSIDRLPRDGKVWRALKGRMVRIGTWHVHSTQLFTGAMLIILGILFLFGIDKLLSTSPLIGWIFDVEERVAAALGITL